MYRKLCFPLFLSFSSYYWWDFGVFFGRAEGGVSAEFCFSFFALFCLFVICFFKIFFVDLFFWCQCIIKLCWYRNKQKQALKKTYIKKACVNIEIRVNLQLVLIKTWMDQICADTHTCVLIFPAQINYASWILSIEDESVKPVSIDVSSKCKWLLNIA